MALLFGGRSGEHEVSIMSARSVVRALDPDRYELFPIAVTREGRWYTGNDPARVLDALAAGHVDALQPVVVVPQPGHPANPPIDVAFPLLHGPMGEDGTIQAVFELAEVPYVGAGVAASAVGMDKDLMKAVFRAAGLPVVAYRVVRRNEWLRHPDRVLEAIARHPGFPAFVKPANLGSSVGVQQAEGPEQARSALDEAFSYDRKALVEASAAPAREVECSVLGADEPEASVPGEILPRRAFYDYEAKYYDEGTRLVVPAELDPAVAGEVRRLALAAFQAVDAWGMARVDFFVKPDGKVWVNEINTIPGFTAVSMYPRLWEASGLPYSRLLDRLVTIAIEMHRTRAALRAAQAHWAPSRQPKGGVGARQNSAQ
ncbi:D-alanine--D-alanine ligase family protein [Carboxydochorda subterranea]|uniref:D-alanine--D-alanine ligase n=1 Tax=Carboxydichorda subterranea TaxID=3109565 RepID=A0ABZ1BWK4_9FIRM|nr:D-alanine--D-alanine ligase family protein [Limnochorda sp. L945t]WRP17076.1 D-alanine--D-alanine ligase family protein [Limnochorda sp. L945t]